MDSSQTNNLFIINHKSSGSKVQIECGLDHKHRPKILSVELIEGNVIPLSGVREAFEQLQQNDKDKNVPDETA